MVNLLLDEDEYVDALEDLLKFAKKYNIPFDGTSERLVEIALTLMLAMEKDGEAFTFTGKLIYNIGVRDSFSFFKNDVVH